MTIEESRGLAATWDAWFDAVKDDQATKEWDAAKHTFSENGSILIGWAKLIELNRLNRLKSDEKADMRS